MISSTEGEIMSTNYVQKGLLKLYWYMLCKNEEYRKDYKKYAETNQGEADMCAKWELLHPFNPFVSREPNDKKYTKEYNELMKNHSADKQYDFCQKWDIVAPFDPSKDRILSSLENYIYIDEKTLSAVYDDGWTDDGMLKVEINLECSRRKIIKDLEYVLDVYKKMDKGTHKNLFSEIKAKDKDYYEDLIYVHKLKSKKKSYKDIYEKGNKEGRGFNSTETVRNYIRRFRALEKKFPVPVKKK
jgi:hypothetical protein